MLEVGGLFRVAGGKQAQEYVCPNCNSTRAAMTKKGAPRRARSRIEELTEAEVQSNLMREANRAGFLVHNNSEHRKILTCECGKEFYSREGSGISIGVADVSIRHEAWPDIHRSAIPLGDRCEPDVPTSFYRTLSLAGVPLPDHRAGVLREVPSGQYPSPVS
jgi:hypothetical protein